MTTPRNKLVYPRELTYSDSYCLQFNSTLLYQRNHIRLFNTKCGEMTKDELQLDSTVATSVESARKAALLFANSVTTGDLSRGSAFFLLFLKNTRFYTDIIILRYFRNRRNVPCNLRRSRNIFD